MTKTTGLTKWIRQRWIFQLEAVVIENRLVRQTITTFTDISEEIMQTHVPTQLRLLRND